MTKMLHTLQTEDVFYADFHGENMLLNKDLDLLLCDFGACAKITDRSGQIRPKGFASQFIMEKFFEKKQTAEKFRERLFNEHNLKMLISHFKLLNSCVEERDEYIDAFAELTEWMEKQLL